ncbi:Hypothetical protein Cul05146_1660 [Corynebacterium ulcerans]|nr:Hypothetical protein Cul05146_1660 [Corynebacterium ulcerans]
MAKPFVTTGGTTKLTPPSPGKRHRKQRRKIQRALAKQITKTTGEETPKP